MTKTTVGRSVAYLGGRGSFSEEACQRFLPTCELMPMPDFEAVAVAVCQGTADVGVLPIHNSIAGPIDAVRVLLAHPELRTIGEEQIDIRLHLLATTGTPDRGHPIGCQSQGRAQAMRRLPRDARLCDGGGTKHRRGRTPGRRRR